jgi:predicted permease
METRFHALGGVRNVGISSYTPMEDNNNGWGVELPGRPESHAIASVIKANAEYFDSVGTRVVMGRGIEVKDTSASRPVAVVNQTFVKHMFHPGENPLGRLFGTGKETANGFEIVGVVEDSAYTDVRWKDHPMFFVPLPQRPLGEKQPLDEDDGMFPGAIVIETTAPMMRMEEMARQTLASINPNLAVVKFQTFTEQIADRFSDDRLIARMTMFFGALALLLATVGLYGVTAYGVARRTSEIGLRMALGAKQSAVVRNVLRGAIAQTVLGLAIGIPAALACVRFVETQLFEIRGADTGLLLTTTIALLIATGLAAWAPARRAAGTDPMKALRME